MLRLEANSHRCQSWPEPEGLEAFRRALPRPSDADSAAGRAILSRAVAHIPDVEADRAYGVQSVAQAATYRSVVSVPLLHDGNPIGAISVGRAHAGPFPERQIELLQTFADQAVIAIRNVRLSTTCRRVRASSPRRWSSRRRQPKCCRSSSSPGELEPVFDAMLANATKLCDASYGAMWLREGDAFRNAAFHGALPAAYVEQWRSATVRPSPDSPLVLVAQSRKPAQVADLRETEAYLGGHSLTVTAADDAGIRTLVAVPMFKEDEFVGAIVIYRKEVRPFTDKQIELVSNFAKQAVIAIENIAPAQRAAQSLSSRRPPRRCSRSSAERPRCSRCRYAGRERQPGCATSRSAVIRAAGGRQPIVVAANLRASRRAALTIGERYPTEAGPQFDLVERAIVEGAISTDPRCHRRSGVSASKQLKS